MSKLYLDDDLAYESISALVGNDNLEITGLVMTDMDTGQIHIIRPRKKPVIKHPQEWIEFTGELPKGADHDDS